jgi:hypothetical protein
MLTLSHPWALLLALPALWLLWISRRRSIETHAVANLFLWRDAPLSGVRPRAERRATPPWLTWLQAAVLVAIAVGIAAPSISASRPDAVLIVDLSTSMSARDGSTSRLELAKTAAKSWVSSQSPRHLIRIIGAGPMPELEGLARGTSAEADAAIDRLAIHPGRDDIAAAIEAAQRETSGPVAVISDRRAPAEASALGVDWKQVGTPVDNVAITAFTATRDGGAVLEVSNFGQSPRTVDIGVAGGSSPWQQHVDIAPNGARSFVLASGKDRTLTASLIASVDGNAIAADDQRRLDIRTSKPRVALVSDDAALRAALEALTDIDLDLTANASFAPSVVVTSGAAAPAGVPSLVFTPGGTVPVITRRDVNAVRAIDVAVDLSKTGWTLTPAFPIFMADAIDWLSGRASDALAAGDEASIAESDTRNTDAPHLAGLERKPAPPAASRLWFPIAIFALAGLLVELLLRRRAMALRVIATATISAAVFGVPLPLGGSSRAAAVARSSCDRCFRLLPFRVGRDRRLSADCRPPTPTSRARLRRRGSIRRAGAARRTPRR